MKVVLCYLIVLTGVLLPGTAFAQRGGDAAHIDGRLSGLQQQLAEHSARIEQLKIQDQQLQQQLERMRTNFEARLDRLEKGGGRKAPVPHVSGQSRP
jgi:TolA-binding protein